MRERNVTSCGCGRSYDTRGGQEPYCPDCTSDRYSEVWSQRVSPEFQAFKSLLYGCLLLLVSLPIYASPEVSINLDKIAYIESGNNPNAVGDSSHALGAYQLHEGVVKDWNASHKDHVEYHLCALEAVCSRYLASWYLSDRIPAMLRAQGSPVTLETVLTGYNKGMGAVKKGKRATAYIKAYKDAL